MNLLKTKNVIITFFLYFVFLNWFMNNLSNAQYKESNKKVKLFNAANNGNIEKINFLMKDSLDLNLQNEKGLTALMIAAQNNQIDVIRLLVELGGNVNILDNDGYSALMFAAQRGYSEIVKTLIDAGAELEQPERILLKRYEEIYKKIMYATLISKDGIPLRFYSTKERFKSDNSIIRERKEKGETLIYGEKYNSDTWNIRLNKNKQYKLTHVIAISKDEENNFYKIWEEKEGKVTLWIRDNNTNLWQQKYKNEKPAIIKKNAMYLAIYFDENKKKVYSKLLSYEQLKLENRIPFLTLDRETGHELIIAPDNSGINNIEKNIKLIDKEIENLYYDMDEEYLQILEGWGAEVQPTGQFIKFRKTKELPRCQDIFKAKNNNWYIKGAEIYKDGKLIDYMKGNKIILGKLFYLHRLRMQRTQIDIEEIAMGKRKGLVIRQNLTTDQIVVFTGNYYVDRYKVRSNPDIEITVPLKNISIWLYKEIAYFIQIDNDIAEAIKRPTALMLAIQNDHENTVEILEKASLK